MAKEGKRMKKAREAMDDALLSMEEAIARLKAHPKAKFDETVEMAVNLGVDPKHADQMVRGVCDLPHGSGRKVRVAVFARGDKAEEAKKAGADTIGAEELVEKISKGAVDFDRCVASPDMMPLVGRLGKILGPRGLMPNPKTGTVTSDVGQTVRRIKQGAVEFRVEKAGLVHAGIGKASFGEKELLANAKAFLQALMKAKPSGAKGNYVKRIALSATMGPGIKVDPRAATVLTREARA